MATLLAGSTFNGVRLWGGNGNAITNTILGNDSGNSLDNTAADNTIVGYRAACTVTCADGNSVAGPRAFGNSGGAQNGYTNFNVVMGTQAMFEVFPEVCANVVIGRTAMITASNTCFNTAIGYNSMKNISSGQKNTFVGYYAGMGGMGMNNANCNVGIGPFALRAVNNGSSNVAIGFQSLCCVSNGSNNVAIGFYSGKNIVNADNTIAIGYCSTTSDNNGHTAAGTACFSCFRVGAGSWTNLSDSRDKTDIENLPDNLGLNFIRNLRPVKFNFDYRDNYVKKCGFEYGTKDGTLKQDFETYGFIAQEIETTLNTIQAEFDALNKNNEGDYRLESESLISPIIKSLQQTIERLEFLESKV
jgi:Chaperone of endosialidase